MFTTLPESRAQRSRRLGGTIASVAVHAALITGAVALTFSRASGSEVTRRIMPRDTVVYVTAEPRVSSSGPARSGGTAIPDVPREPALPRIPSFDVATPVMPADDQDAAFDPAAEFTGHALVSSPGTTDGRGALPGADGVVGEREADRAPRMVGTPVEPRYPEALRGAGIGGHVLAQFVVDTLGRAEAGSVEVIEATRPEFADAVLAALPRMRFTAGEAAGRKVRTRVRIPFDFTLR